jgi:hypothetical protein
MIQPCWYKLKIDNSFAFLEDITTFVADKDYYSWFNVLKINPLWIDYMRSFGLEVDYNILFYRNSYISKYEKTMAHVDIKIGKNKKLVTCSPAINWVLGSTNSKTIWFEKSDKLKLIKTDQSFRNWKNNPYSYTAPISHLNKIDEANIGFTPVLYRVDVPHAVLQNGEKRWAVSVRFKNLSCNWNKSFNFLKEKNLIIDR